MMEPALALENVSAGYGSRQVLWDLSLSIEPGGRTLIVGPNGSGKSTLLRVVSGLLRPSRGTVLMNGVDITSLRTDHRIHRGLGYLLQERNIFPRLRVRENLELAYPKYNVAPFESQLEWVTSLFPALKKHLDSRAGVLSGGERQALAVSMILMQPSQVMLLDEPTAGLSPAAAREILQGIEQALLTEQRTLVVVEHNLSIIGSWISRVVALVEGRVALDEHDVASVLDNTERLERLYFGQVG